MEGDPPESWDQTKVTPVKSSDGEWVPVPIGFTASKAEGEQAVNTGFVVYEGIITEPEVADETAWTEEEAWQLSLDKNQFVWIPVENASERIYESTGEKNPKKSRLWNFSSTGRSQITQGNGGNKREPWVMTSNYDSLRYLKNYLNYQDYSRDAWYKELQVEYDTAMKSIEKYGGFYIGRYETGAINTNTPVVRRMNTTISNQSWYAMYLRMRNISSNQNIQTSMIWGCLWDETLQWLIDTGVKTYADMTINSASWGNYYDATFEYKTNTSGSTATKNKNSGTRIPAGSAEYTKSNNIYDLAGNVNDLTLEGSSLRCCRGGSYATQSGMYGRAQYRAGNQPGDSYVTLGFRAYFYIK